MTARFSGELDATWGDTVRVKANAPISMRPGAVAEVVGIRDINTPDQAAQFDIPVGATVYLIEFGNGDSMEVADKWLEAIEE